MGIGEIWLPVHTFFQPESTYFPYGINVTFRTRLSKSELKSEGEGHHFRTYNAVAITPITENGRTWFSGAKQF